MFVVSCGDTAELFEFGEEALNAPSVLIGNDVICMLMSSMSARRNDRLAALVEDKIVQAVSVIGAISQNLPGGQTTDQITGRSHVILLAWPERKPHRQAKCVYDSVDFGAEPAARASKSLGFNAPLFIRPPAACACARMIVASMASHSRSGSSATASNIRSKTP